MKRILSVPSIALLLLIWSSSAKAAKNAFVVAGDNSGGAPTLLAQPDPSAQSVTSLNVGDPIVISNLPTHGYYKARAASGQIGWIAINSVSTTPPAGSNAAPAPQAAQGAPAADTTAAPAAPAAPPAASSDAILDESLPPPPDEAPPATPPSPAPQAVAEPVASPSPVAPPQPVATASAAPEAVPSAQAPVVTAPLPAPSALASPAPPPPQPEQSPQPVPSEQPVPEAAQPQPTPTEAIPYEDVQPSLPEGQPEQVQQSEQEEEEESSPWLLKAFGGIESLDTVLSFSASGVKMPSTAADLGVELGIPASDRVHVLLRVEHLWQNSTQLGDDLSLSTTPIMTGVSYSFLPKDAKVKLRGAILLGVALGTEFDVTAPQSPPPNTASVSTQAFTEMLTLDLEVPVASWVAIDGEAGFRYLDSSSVGPTVSGVSLFPTNVTFPLKFTGFFGTAGLTFYL